MKQKNWYKPKAYTHFSPKLDLADTGWVSNYVSDKEKVSKHGFFPLLHRTIVAKRYKKTPGTSQKRHYIIHQGKRKTTAKFREIYYANHLDAHVYSYYTQKILEPLYETELKSDPELDKSVLAYRRVELEDKSRCKCNIDFANETFNEIKNYSGETAVLALDISKFFDSLDHKILKKAWAKLLGRIDLEPDHYNIFKNITRFNYVEMKDILNEFGYKHANDLIQKEVTHILKDSEEFRNRIKAKGFIKLNPFRRENKMAAEKKMIGIPQGTPISAFLANLYLLEFDKYILEILKPIKGIYRRYADDILIICPKENHKEIEDLIYNQILTSKLIIQETKTQRTFFNNGRLEKRQQPIGYLGFQFDGNRKTIKSASLAKFYRKMKKNVRYKASRAFLARKKREKGLLVDAKLHRGDLYKRFSYLGAKFTKKKKRNFISYVHFASKVMNSPHINLQMSNAWGILHREIHKYETRYELQT